MTQNEIKTAIKGFVAKGFYYPVENGEYVGGCYVDRAIDRSGVNIALAAIIGIDGIEAIKLIEDGSEPVAVSANKAGDEDSIEVSVNYDERSGYYTLNEFAEKFGE